MPVFDSLRQDSGVPRAYGRRRRAADDADEEHGRALGDEQVDINHDGEAAKLILRLRRDPSNLDPVNRKRSLTLKLLHAERNTISAASLRTGTRVFWSDSRSVLPD